MNRRLNLCAENTHYLETKEKNCAKEWIGSNARFGPVLEIKVCKTIGGHLLHQRGEGGEKDKEGTKSLGDG